MNQFRSFRGSQAYTSSIMRHVCWIAENKIAYVQYDEEQETDVLSLATLSAAFDSVQSIATCPLEKPVGRMYYNVTFKDLVVEAMDGSVFEGTMALLNARNDNNNCLCYSSIWGKQWACSAPHSLVPRILSMDRYYTRWCQGFGTRGMTTHAWICVRPSHSFPILESGYWFERARQALCKWPIVIKRMHIILFAKRLACTDNHQS